MPRLQTAVNPFALMMDPQSVLRAVESSERLARLKRHICRPLDKPLIPKIGEAIVDDSDIDTQLDA